jgi:DNA-binding NarL/FixJ family response regulator
VRGGRVAGLWPAQPGDCQKLAISEGTVKVHLHQIYKKLQVPSRLALLQYAYQRGWL